MNIYRATNILMSYSKNNTVHIAIRGFLPVHSGIPLLFDGIPTYVFVALSGAH
jgi:hypothetical protein